MGKLRARGESECVQTAELNPATTVRPKDQRHTNASDPRAPTRQLHHATGSMRSVSTPHALRRVSPTCGSRVAGAAIPGPMDGCRKEWSDRFRRLSQDWATECSVRDRWPLRCRNCALGWQLPSGKGVQVAVLGESSIFRARLRFLRNGSARTSFRLASRATARNSTQIDDRAETTVQTRAGAD